MPVQSTVVSDIMATPKKLLRAWEGRSGDIQKIEEELMSTRIKEVEALTELKELRLKVFLNEAEALASMRSKASAFTLRYLAPNYGN